MEIVNKYAKWVFFLIPIAIIGGIFGIIESVPASNFIFLGIFGFFMGLEYLYDYKLKLNFRHNWKLLVPYLILYYAMNYGLVMMPWSMSLPIGIIILCLFIIQIAVNIWTHK